MAVLIILIYNTFYGVAMHTKYYIIDPLAPNPEILAEVGRVISRGGLAAFPTETVYGLGANALDGLAVAGIFAAKGRPADNPLIVHVADMEIIPELAAEVPERAITLMKAFWPGPLTIILPVGEKVPVQVTAGLNTVALRMPGHPVALGLIRAAGVPIAAPSANTSGRPSPTTAEHVQHDLTGHIDIILDAGPADVGLESTVLDLTVPIPTILRPGGITPDKLKAVLDEVAIAPAAAEAANMTEPPRSPGMKYTHYAPKAPLYLIEGEGRQVAVKIKELAGKYRDKGQRVGILTYVGGADFAPYGLVLLAGKRESPETVAASLYSVLRRFDQSEVDVILAEGVEDQGIGIAVMNRLRKAAREVIIMHN